MRILVLLSLVIAFASCTKNQGSCQLFRITHSVSLGNDTLNFHNHPNGQIFYVTNGTERVDYQYDNGFLRERKRFINGTLSRIDSITYNSSLDIESVSLHDITAGTFRKTNFTYNGLRFSSASYTITTPSSSNTTSVSFEYTGNNISKIAYAPGSVYDSVVYTYSTGLNPLWLGARHNVFNDPYYSFTAEDIYRLPLFFSENPLSSIKRYRANTMTAFYFTITPESGRIKSITISPTGEGIDYDWACPE
jgi:hypothetical protein